MATTSTGSATPSPSGRELGSSGASGALLPPLAGALPVQWRRCRKTSLSDLCCLLGLLWLLCETDSRPSMVRLAARKMSCGSGFVNTRPGRNNNFVNGNGLKLVRMSSFRVQDPMRSRFEMLQANMRIRWKLSRHEVSTFRQCRGASRVVWARVEMRLIFAVRQCEKRLRSIDFCFLREDAAAYDVAEPVPENPWATILCAVDVATQNPLAIALPGKNAELEYAIGQLSVSSKGSGTRNWSSGATESLPLRQLWTGSWRRSRRQVCRHEFDQKKTPRYSSQSLGAVRSMQSLLQKQVRTLKTDLETKVKSHLLTSMAVWPWLERHSAWLVERYQMRANGRTSYQDCFGTVYTGIMLRFGEQAIFRHPVGTAAGRNRQTFKQSRKEKAANKMDLGIWLGKTYETV